MDFRSMNMKQLKALHLSVAKEIERRANGERKKAIDEIRALVKARGLKLEELISEKPQRQQRVAKAAKPGKPKGKRAPAKIKYRHPEQKNLTWTGRGRQPKWVAEWLAAGKTLAGLGA